MINRLKKLFILGNLLLISGLVSAQIIDKRGVNQQWKTDLTQKSVELNEFMALLPHDRIMPIDNPVFLNGRAADQKYNEKEPVIVIERNGKARAYPLSILMAHEIVNDEFEGLKLVATFCPLCYSALIYNREVTYKNETRELTFGTSGMLRNSDLVMWDRQTESWWQQFTGEGLVGYYSGAELEVLFSELLPFGEFRDLYPEGTILGPPTDYNYEYGTNPYVDYDQFPEATPFLYKDEPDKRLPPTERVIGIYGKDFVKAYPWTLLRKEKVVNDIFEKQDLVLFFSKGMLSVVDERDISKSRDVGAVTVYSSKTNDIILHFKPFGDRQFKDTETKSIWNIQGECVEGELKGNELTPIIHGQHFAFAWLAFYPTTLIYGNEN